MKRVPRQPSAPALVLDAMNVVYAWGLQGRGGGSLAVMELVQRCLPWVDHRGWLLIVVVDQTSGIEMQDRSAPQGVELVFADASQTADGWIEARLLSSPDQVAAVVSADAAVARAARIANTEAWSPERLQQEIAAFAHDESARAARRSAGPLQQSLFGGARPPSNRTR